MFGPDQEALLKRAADEQHKYGIDQCCAEEMVRPCLRERVEHGIDRARDQSHQLNKLEELKGLLERNPEVARIIELIDELEIR